MRTIRSLALIAALCAVMQPLPAEEAAPPASLAYQTTADLNARLREVVGRACRAAPEGFPPPAQVVVVGTSLRGEEILAVEIGAGIVAPPLPENAPGALRRNHGRRQALLVVAGIEGDRLVGTSVATKVIEDLLALGADELAALLREHQVYVVPRMNPDGAHRYFAGLPASSWQADGQPRYEHPGNARVLDRDRDGRRVDTHEGPLQLAEDGPIDLDGDGEILQMRWQDPKGTLIEDAEDARVMYEADAANGEDGLYLQADEGTDADGDGDFAENSAAGVNPNRNFSHAFVEHDLESGLFATSEPESRALLDYVLARKNIAMVVVYGAHDNLGEVPEATKAKPAEEEGGGGRFRRGGREPATKLHAVDREILVSLAELRKEAGGLPGKNVGEAQGAFHQWAYFHFGVPAAAVNLFQVDDGVEAAAKRREEAKKEAPGAKKKGKPGKDEGADAPPAESGGDEAAAVPADDDEKEEGEEEAPDPVAIAQEQAAKDGFVAWHEVEHPILGKVEVGGWRPYLRGNPSPEIAALLAARELEFLEGVFARFSHVHLATTTVTRAGAGLYEVEAVIANDGRLPSAVQQGIDNREALPVIVLLDTPQESLLQGQRRQMIDRLEAKVGERRLKWLVRGKAGSKIQLVVAPPRSHPITTEVELP